MKTLVQLFKNEDGATAIEYGLIAALVSVAAIIALSQLGLTLSNTFDAVSANLTNAQTR